MRSSHNPLRIPVATFSSIAFFSALSVAQATTIDSWNLGNVDVDQGPYVVGEEYSSVVYTDGTKTTTNGAVIWKEGAVIQPGMQVLTDSPEGSGRNCIITTGTNRADPASPDKTCSDEFQSAKRVKTDARVPSTSIDLVFDVSTAEGDSSRTYRVFQKYINSILERMDAFSIQLGYGTGDAFVPSTTGDGLAFTSRDGSQVPPNSTPPGNSDLGSLMSAGLFGEADFNQNITRDGYFKLPETVITGLDGNQCATDPSGTGRSYWNLTASEDEIATDGTVQGLHYCLFGNMLGQSQLPYGYFYDEDGNPDTDATTVANWNGASWETYVLIDPVTGVPQFDDTGDYLRPDNPPVPVPDNVVAQWCNQKDTLDGVTPFLFVAVLDDMGLTNNNYHINVAADLSSIGETFTLRITNTGETNVLATPWLAQLPPEIDPDYVCPPVEPPPAAGEVDVWIKDLDVDRRVTVNEREELEVYIKNDGPNAASGTVTVTGTDSDGVTVVTLSDEFTDLAAKRRDEIEFDWKAPSYPTVISWVAEVTAAGDTDLGNNTATATTEVVEKKRRRKGRRD